MMRLKMVKIILIFHSVVKVVKTIIIIKKKSNNHKIVIRRIKNKN